jgi:hypothetical protein
LQLFPAKAGQARIAGTSSIACTGKSTKRKPARPEPAVLDPTDKSSNRESGSPVRPCCVVPGHEMRERSLYGVRQPTAVGCIRILLVNLALGLPASFFSPAPSCGLWLYSEQLSSLPIPQEFSACASCLGGDFLPSLFFDLVDFFFAPSWITSQCSTRMLFTAN